MKKIPILHFQLNQNTEPVAQTLFMLPWLRIGKSLLRPSMKNRNGWPLDLVLELWTVDFSEVHCQREAFLKQRFYQVENPVLGRSFVTSLTRV